MSEYIQVAGKSDIYIGYPGAQSTLIKIGEQLNETRSIVEHFKDPVFGDRHGGEKGPPIEIQMLGMLQTIVFNLSRWDEEVYEELQKHDIWSTAGKVEDSEPGTLLLLDHSYRVCIVPSKDNTNVTLTYDPFFKNLVCCEISQPIEIGQGTKHSLLQFAVTAHRAPEGHSKAGFLWDRDNTGVP